jgi:hypothetical protein
MFQSGHFSGSSPYSVSSFNCPGRYWTPGGTSGPRSAALEELKKVRDVRVGNATEAQRAATERVHGVNAEPSSLSTGIIAAEDLFKSSDGTVWTATLRSSYNPGRNHGSVAVILRALIQLSADCLASLSATQSVTSSSNSSSSNACRHSQPCRAGRACCEPC